MTIDEALSAFLAEERERLSERTMRNYGYVVELLSDSLNGYGPNGLEKATSGHDEVKVAGPYR